MFAPCILLLIVADATCGAGPTTKEDIWNAWGEREKALGAMQFEYKTYTMREGRRDSSSVVCRFDTNQQLTCKSNTLVKGKKLPGFSTEEFIGPQMSVSVVSRVEGLTSATINTRRFALNKFGEPALPLILFRPAFLFQKDDCELLDPVQINSHECELLRRVYESSRYTITQTIYLQRDMGYLPVRTSTIAKSAGIVFQTSESNITYEQVREVYVPKAWIFTQAVRPNGPSPTHVKKEAVRTHFHANAKEGMEFTITLPKDTQLLDRREEPFVRTVLTEEMTFAGKGNAE